MRDLATVIDVMLAHIPADKMHLRAMLDGRKVACLYTAPEAMGRRWWQVADVIAAELGPHPHVEDWQKAVCDVFTGRSDK